MTANQLVAYNLKRARELQGWTQEEAAEKLEPYLGVRWSKATFSAAETSVSGKRTREFSADELLAFTRAFDLSLAWFFLPAETIGFPKVSCGGERELTAGQLLDALFPHSGADATLARMSYILRSMPKSQRTKRDQLAINWTVARVAAAVLAVTEDVRAVATQNRLTADLLEQVAETALEQAGKELDAETARAIGEEVSVG